MKYDCVNHGQIVSLQIPRKAHNVRRGSNIYLRDCLVSYSKKRKEKGHYLTMRRDETLWLLMGVNLTLKDLTSPGSRRRLYTKGLVEPSTNPELVFNRDVCQTNSGSVRANHLQRAASATTGLWWFQPADSLNSGLTMKSTINLVALTWFLCTWNSSVFVLMLMLDKLPNGNLGNKVGQGKMRG